MSPHRVESSASRGLSLADRAASLSSYSTPIIFGWRKCLCDDREVLVTSHSSKNPELLLWGCPNWKRGLTMGRYCVTTFTGLMKLMVVLMKFLQKQWMSTRRGL
ncbi:hypothetical protein JHK82_040202 [Glycine max]|uniref:Uncharacterized protein n=2 Tax=Glycine subgen. Soja TaxID=1462606 RepID=K7M7E9_SOYBN|nr:hypothetical protein JHK87_040214 [Glycine soja]KAG4963535.1 hypothetical protein JHK86_040403 [Glycine max]KAG4966013.1 hypothetical protein JHK85_040988 [Glycine max]KAG5110979.1 hypothetical protein JHK82_040202 [Glycine max]KAG5122271.1 hypothetical protein JHK84_040611 [Glycine max]